MASDITLAVGDDSRRMTYAELAVIAERLAPGTRSAARPTRHAAMGPVVAAVLGSAGVVADADQQASPQGQDPAARQAAKNAAVAVDAA
jgi:hypothetical protein